MRAREPPLPKRKRAGVNCQAGKREETRWLVERAAVEVVEQPTGEQEHGRSGNKERNAEEAGAPPVFARVQFGKLSLEPRASPDPFRCDFERFSRAIT